MLFVEEIHKNYLECISNTVVQFGVAMVLLELINIVVCKYCKFCSKGPLEKQPLLKGHPPKIHEMKIVWSLETLYKALKF